MAIRRRTGVKRSLRAIERAFADLESTLKRLSTRVQQLDRATARGVGGGGAQRGARRPVTLTPQRRAQLKLQGAYMGFMRQLKPAQKARVKALKAKRGYQAAIRLAKSLAS